MDQNEALAYLLRDGDLLSGGSRYGRHTSDCAPVAIALAEIYEDANGQTTTTDDLDYFMGLVVNEHDDIRSLIIDHGTADQIALIADSLTDEARAAGETAGKARGSWVIDGNTSRETAARIVAGYNDGDPEVMDLQPAPLSGEWAGESIRELSEEYGLPLWDDTVAEAFERGYSDGFWTEVLDSARD
jgi:hypothetical protein